MRLLYFFLISGFWIVPGRLTLLDGPTHFIGLTDIPVLLALGFVCFVLPMKPQISKRAAFAAVFVSLAVLRLLMGSLYLENGLVARYYSNPDFQGSAEQSWAFKNLEGATRVDPKIDFHNAGYSPFRQSFPLYFVNDWDRFNWLGAENVKRKNFQFSAQWMGYLNIQDDDPHQLVLNVSGGHARLRINGQEIVSSPEGQETFVLAAGLHTIELEYARLGDGERRLMLGWKGQSGSFVAIPSSRFQTMPESYSINATLAVLNVVLLIAWLVALTWFIRTFFEPPSATPAFRERATLFSIVALLLIIAGGTAVANGRVPHGDILSGGNDWLLYETQAQNILSGDWLDANTTDSGVYKMNVLYRYLLAGLHTVFGESKTVVIFGHQALMIGILLFLYWMGKSLYSPLVGVLAAAQAVVFQDMILVFPRDLLDTTFNIGFSLLALYYLLLYGRTQLLRNVVLAGLFLALAISVRMNFALLILVGMGWIWLQGYRHKQSRFVHIALFMVLTSLPFAATGLRNLVVADQFVIVPGTGALNLWLGNRSVAELSDRDSFFPAYYPPKEQMLGQVYERIRNHPLDFATGIAIKATYVVGVDLREELEIRARIFIPAIIALFSIMYWLTRADSGPVRPEVLLMTMWIIALTAPVVAIFPWAYGWRLIGSVLPVWYLLNALLVAAILRGGNQAANVDN